jgi:plastocyanin
VTSPTPKRSNTAWYIGAVVIIVVIVLSSALTYQLTQSGNSGPSSPTSSPSGVTMTLSVYAGELSDSKYGFGNSSASITSPGPTFTIKVGTTVTVNFVNAGTMDHNWAVVTQNTSGNTNLAFSKAQVASAGNPVSSGGKGSATFVANKAGTYYYICQVDGHAALGMWGNFIVTP